jgi:hypothetical protein
MVELIAKTLRGRTKNLVFTSAGDNANVRAWLTGQRDFDLWVVYYGDRPGTFLEESDLYVSRQGSKFQNLHYCYSKWQDVLARYEAVMVMDDDIVINATDLTSLFAIRREFDLWALQPAFRLAGKISWDITRVQPTARLRYTNFIEMACPLFRRDKLDAFMAVYDPELIGYGEDWWFLHTFGAELVANHVAIVDEITCINPSDRTKGGRREIDRLHSHEERKEVWERIKARYGLDERGREQKEYGRIGKSPFDAAIGLIRYLPDWTYYNGKGLLRRLLR